MAYRAKAAGLQSFALQELHTHIKAEIPCISSPVLGAELERA